MLFHFLDFEQCLHHGVWGPLQQNVNHAIVVTDKSCAVQGRAKELRVIDVFDKAAIVGDLINASPRVVIPEHQADLE